MLSVNDLSLHYEVGDERIHALDGVSFQLEPRSISGLLGESGCGKSTLAETIVRHLDANARVTSGEVLFKGKDVLEMSEERLREIRWSNIAYIPQAAMNSLNPVATLKEQLIEPVVVHESMSQSDAIERAREVLEMVDIDESRLEAYPHQLSGGMKQRAIVAMAMILEPDVIIADEPTTGLDVLVRDKILNDLERFRDELDVSIIFVSHDIADLVETSDSLLVMYGGKIVEKGPSRALFETPTHPYTIGLKNSLPNVNTDLEDLIRMEMDPPDLRSLSEGCRFVDRCPFDEPVCHEEHPSYRSAITGIESACYRADEFEELNRRAQDADWLREDLEADNAG